MGVGVEIVEKVDKENQKVASDNHEQILGKLLHGSLSRLKKGNKIVGKSPIKGKGKYTLIVKAAKKKPQSKANSPGIKGFS